MSALLAVAFGRQALRVARAWPGGRRVAHGTRSFQRISPRAPVRVLILGDSTAVGVGAERPQHSVAGWLAHDLPDAEIINLASTGATVAKTLDALRSAAGPRREARFDLVVVQAGGVDVLELTPLPQVRANAGRLLDTLGDDAARCVWLSPANVGLAPVFVAPFSWWLSARTLALVAMLRREVQARGAKFVSFCFRRADDPFSRNPGLWFAADGLHPSETSYLWCYRKALRERALQLRSAAAASGSTRDAFRCRDPSSAASDPMPGTARHDGPARETADDRNGGCQKRSPSNGASVSDLEHADRIDRSNRRT